MYQWKLSSDIDIQCDACKGFDFIPSSFIRFGHVGHQRNSELPYLFEFQYDATKAVSCEHCGAYIRYEASIVEFPAGIIVQHLEEIYGGTVLNTPHLVKAKLQYCIPEPEFQSLDQKISEDVADVEALVPQLIQLVQDDITMLHRMHDRTFEHVVGEIFRAKGFKVEITARTGDKGKDVIAIRRDELDIPLKYFVECKKNATDNKVSVGIVRNLHAVHNTINGPNVSIIATTSSFTKPAITYATKEVTSPWELQLADVNRLLGWLCDYKSPPIYPKDVFNLHY